MLNDTVLVKRIDEFLGYGNFNSDYWVIGMEEGGGNTLDEIEERLIRWKELSYEPLVDNYEFHRKILGDFKVNGSSQKKNLSCYFDGKIRIQKTWGALIRVILNIENYTKIDADSIKDYQSKHWGRTDSNNCLLEIFPLPSPNANDWHYAGWSNLPFLSTREKYISTFKEKRISLVKKHLKDYSPKFVFFYSLNKDYIKFWENISEVSFNENNKVAIYNQFYAYAEKKDGVTYILTGQPSYIRAHEYWNRLGLYLRNF